MADMVKMALTMAEKHGEKLKELAMRAERGEVIAKDLSQLSREFQSSLEMIRRLS